MEDLFGVVDTYEKWELSVQYLSELLNASNAYIEAVNVASAPVVIDLTEGKNKLLANCSVIDLTEDEKHPLTNCSVIDSSKDKKRPLTNCSVIDLVSDDEQYVIEKKPKIRKQKLVYAKPKSKKH